MSYAAHDLALESMTGVAPELRNGGPNHAPMVIEALAALGRHQDVLPWLEHYRDRLAEGPRTASILDEGQWAAARGRFELLGEWQNLFRADLARLSWRDVLERWLPRLIPGSMAAGTHGVIRAAHAVRALRNEVTAVRLDELAMALAYCAARYRTLGPVPRLSGELGLEAALRALPLLEPDVDRRGPPPQIVRVFDERPEFAAAVDRLAPPADIPAALAALAEVGARRYLDGADRHPLVLLHAVTGPAAVHLLVADASAELRHVAFSYAWQAVAAWVAAFGGQALRHAHRRFTASWDEIVARAVDVGDEHAIKLTEACLRLDRHAPSPAFRAAAGDWSGRAENSRAWSSRQRIEAGISTRAAEGSRSGVAARQCS